MPCGAESGRAAASASGQTRTAASMEGPPAPRGGTMRPSGRPRNEGVQARGTATDYGCCESKRSEDRQSKGLPAGLGEAVVKWLWISWRRDSLARSHNPSDRREASLETEDFDPPNS